MRGAVTTLADGIETAKEAVASGNYDQAIAWCRHVLRYHPKNVDAHWLLAEAYREQGRSDEAEDLCQRVLSAAPDNLIARWGLALILEEHNDLQEAVWHLERALEYNPGHAELQSEIQRISSRPAALTPGGLAHLYLRGALYDRAADQFQAAIGVEGPHLEYLVALTETLWYARRCAEADEVAQRVLADSPDCLKANLVAGLVRKLSPGQEAEAEPYLERARRLDPTDAVLRALLTGVGLAETFPAAAKVELPPLSEEAEQPTPTPAVAEPTVSWLEDVQPLPLDWLGEVVPEKARPGEPGQAAIAETTPVSSPPAAISADYLLPAEAEPMESDLADQIALEPELEPSIAAEPAATEPAEPELDDWKTLAEKLAAADAEQPTTSPAEFPTLDEVRATWGEEWADLVAQEVTLDPESERRLNEAIADLVGEVEPAQNDEWQTVQPGTITQRRLSPLDPAVDSADAGSAEAPAPLAPESVPFGAEEPTEAPQHQDEVRSEIDEAVVDPLIRRLEENPGDHKARLALATAYQQAGDPELAAAEYRRLIREAPGLVPQLIDNLKWLSYTWPDCAAAHRALGDAYMRTGLFQQAIEEYNSVLAKRQPPQAEP